MYSLGIDIGYSSIKTVLIDEFQNVKFNCYKLHKGKMLETLKEMVIEIGKNFDYAQIQYAAATGSGSKLLTQSDNINHVNEVAALIEGGKKLYPDAGSIIEIGGESAKFITGLNKTDSSQIEIAMNSNCSAGTGSFFEEQMSRLRLNLGDYSSYTAKAGSIPRIAGRCSVFAKTDIIHHQQEGTAVEDILLGLAYAVIRNYKGTVVKKIPVSKPVLFIGGVANNQGVITAINDVFSFENGDMVIPEYFESASAIGTAMIAMNGKMVVKISDVIRTIENADIKSILQNDGKPYEPLSGYGNNDGVNKHNSIEITEDENIECHLGVDIGSTSTNLVLINQENGIIFHSYLRTLGDPAAAVKKGLGDIENRYANRIKIRSVGITGSGRYMIGELIGADVIKDEITAQAKAAVTINKSVDTIFEIGGQDSKYISLKNGVVTDFQMNKICAAGTGSFIEEQSLKFNIPIEQFGNIALSGKTPAHLGERCTVFIESSIAGHLAIGTSMEDIASGLCYSIVRNYLDRIVGQKKIGETIFLQGGIAYNQGIVNAFRTVTGKTIVVPPFFSVTGAFGVALMAKEEIGNRRTAFNGFNPTMQKQYSVAVEKKELTEFDKNIQQTIFGDYNGKLDSNKKTVGIPRALFTYGMFPMFGTIFNELGLNILLSEPTDEKTIALGQQYALDETCFPVKLITGHVAELVDKKVDYIFFPDFYTVDHPGSPSRQNYGCAYMQVAFKIINETMELNKKGIELLAPTIAFNLGKEFMMNSFGSLGKQLGKSSEETGRALQKGMEAFLEYERKMEENQEITIRNLDPNKKTFVMISKIYGIADPVLNMGIPGKLSSMGFNVLPFYNMPEADLSVEHPNMFWPFGQHILEPADIVKKHPNLYAILLTHHGCGPDSMLSHYFKELMGGKPYLHIEVDEHSSSVGIITRVEAFINSLKNIDEIGDDKKGTYVPLFKNGTIKKSIYDIADTHEIYLPYSYPYSSIITEILKTKGINAKQLPQTCSDTLDIGRQFTLTEEYFSLTSLLGDVFSILKYKKQPDDTPIGFYIPQNEGTETDGQYHRLLRTKLDEEGFHNIDIAAPFTEDILCGKEEDAKLIYLALIAGDMVLTSPKIERENYLVAIKNMIKDNCFNLHNLKLLAVDIHRKIRTVQFKKKLFAVGETAVLYNNFLNNFVLSTLEDEGHRVVYAPLGEAMWLMWNDYSNQNKNDNTPLLKKRLNEFKYAINSISECLFDSSPYEKVTESLSEKADKTVGYYSGAFGRYRFAKVMGDLSNIDGVITVASLYENTGIAMNILLQSFKKEKNIPLLNLTFDGNKVSVK